MKTLDQLRREADDLLARGIADAFTAADGNMVRTAALLQANRPGLYTLMKRLGFEFHGRTISRPPRAPE